MKGITVDKLRKRLYQVSEGLELIIALVAVVGVVIAKLHYVLLQYSMYVHICIGKHMDDGEI